MRVFVTGATGFIGARIVAELLGSGYRVLGLTRSDAGAKSLVEAGAEVHHGTLEDPETLRKGAAQADAVIHTAFDHDFSNFVANCQKDKRAIEALGAALAGSDRPLIITSGTGMGNAAPGQPASEEIANFDHPNPRIASELAGAALSDAGINVSVVRLPQVHDTVKQGLVTPLVAIARRKGFAAYVGDGLNRWPAAHVLDVARLYRLALERHRPGARYHAVAEEGIAALDIVTAVGNGLSVPVASIPVGEASEYFGWLGAFAGFDMPASSAKTREWLGWNPTGPGLLADLAAMDYAVETAI
jgi:nucleoside-diphosphate-sugar epimerase